MQTEQPLMKRPIPQNLIDTLPKGYTILGLGGEFELADDDCIINNGVHWYDGGRDSPWLTKWGLDDFTSFFAAPSDSEIVELNATKGNLPYITPKQHTPADFQSKAKEFMYGAALPTDAAKRKEYPVYSGFLTYFPHAIAAVANLSYQGNMQHHPDKPLHWDMDKSSDELDALMRHMIDEDWVHVAWRAMSNLERKLTGKCQYEKDGK